MMRLSPGDTQPTAVSVIIPCFNAATYVGESIACVLDQILPGDEVVVVDDGSTDDSLEVIASFGRQIHCVRQANQGISGARNTGLMHSQCGLIAFLDADDLWSTGSLDARRRALSSDSRLDYVWGGVQAFISPELDANAQAAIGMLPPTRGGRLAGTLLVRRKVFNSVGGFDQTFQVGETLDWVARADAAGFRSRELPQNLLHRRVHGANTMVKQQRMQGDYLRALRASIERRRVMESE
jgi:glycosyltransferase involved in cell wall biosynthesis